MDSFDRLTETVSVLMGENGCPWDRVQTHESLKPCMLEECYEVLDAIDNKDDTALCEELGDVLLQVVFHGLIAQKEGRFTLDDVADAVDKKMIYRHPHIFSDKNAEVSAPFEKWEEIKKREKGYQTKTEIMRSVAKTLPALVRAQKVIKKSKVEKTEKIDNSFDLAQECLENLKQSKNDNKQHKMEILGNLLMQILNISNFFEINAEFSLTNALETYITKLEDFENMSAAVGKTIEDTGLEEADVFVRSLMSKSSK